MARSRERAVTAHTAPTAGVTLWRRIADDLERAIAAGEIAPGERLPGETEIAARFAVNRHTVRRAIAELAGRGLVRAAPRSAEGHAGGAARRGAQRERRAALPRHQLASRRAGSRRRQGVRRDPL